MPFLLQTLISQSLSMNQITTYGQQFQALAMLYLPRVLMAGLALVVGWWAVGWVSRLIAAAARRLDVSLASFLTSLVNIVLKVLLLITVAGMIGFETTSFVAILGAAGLAVGLALQGTLANFAGGVLILIFKPYIVGDTIILPNGATSNNVIVNKTAQNKAIIEIPAEVDNSTDLSALRGWAIPLMQADADVVATPAPQVVVTALRPGGLAVVFRAYTLAGLNTPAHARLVEQLQQALAQHGVAGPVPVSHSYVRTLPV